MINVLVLTALVMLGGLPGQAKPPAPPPAWEPAVPMPIDTSPAAPAEAPPQRAEYLVGPQDVLTISVFEEPQLSGRYTVNNDGTIAFPMVGRVAAGGLSPRAIEEALRKALSSGYLKNPQITVEVEQYRSQSITVTGEVRTPGRYPLSGRMTVLDALVQAGSVIAGASNEVQILRPKPGASAPTVANADVLRVNISDLQSGKLANNVALLDGDTVFVPKAEPFFVTGQVRTPGAYPLQRGMTVLQALSLAGGLTDRGSTRRIKIIRVTGGKKREITVALTDIVEPGDTIVVPQRFF